MRKSFYTNSNHSFLFSLIKNRSFAIHSEQRFALFQILSLLLTKRTGACERGGKYVSMIQGVTLQAEGIAKDDNNSGGGARTVVVVVMVVMVAEDAVKLTWQQTRAFSSPAPSLRPCTRMI